MSIWLPKAITPGPAVVASWAPRPELPPPCLKGCQSEITRESPLGFSATSIVLPPWWQSQRIGMTPPLLEPPSLPITICVKAPGFEGSEMLPRTMPHCVRT